MEYKRLYVFFLSIPVIVLSSGCAGPKPTRMIQLMPAPIYTQVEDEALQGEKAPRLPTNAIKQLYATDRQPSEDPTKPPFYYDKKGYVLRLGKAYVQMGKMGDRWEDLVSRSHDRDPKTDVPLTIVRTEEYGPLKTTLHPGTTGFSKSDLRQGSRQFAREINNHLASSRSKDIFVYVHGFKIDYPKPIMVATSLWHFMDYDGVMIAYSWPSTLGKLTAYVTDIETGKVSVRAFREFLQYLAANTEAKRIHIIAYSAGTRLAADALNQLGLMHANVSDAEMKRKTRIGQAVFIAGDISLDAFGSLLDDQLYRLPDAITIYTSQADQALEFSQWFFLSARLGGNVETQLTGKEIDLLRQDPKITLIDATKAEGAVSGNGHGYFKNSPWVSSDLLSSLRYNLPPAQRGLVRPEESILWTFPPDYPDRHKRNLEQIR
jgi:esterase/lipase superfamily enzyme